MSHHAHTVICGAGIAGIATAHALAVKHGIRDVVLVDEGAPLSLTSDKSSECYRNWWSGPDDAMVRLMSRSIDLLEEGARASNNRFRLNRRGYLFASADPAKVEEFLATAELSRQQGAGDVRVYRSVNAARQYRPSTHEGFEDHPTGADLFLDQEAIRTHFPYLSPDIVAVLHARRCGWFSGQQYGMYLLEEARAAGVTLLSGTVHAVDVRDSQVSSVAVGHTDGTTTEISTSHFVNAAGPHARSVAALVGVDLPIFSELHLKLAFEDTLGVVDRDCGLVIFADEQHLAWSDEEREDLAADVETRWLTEPMPMGVHLRPEGYRHSQTVIMLWDYHSHHRYDTPVFPLPEDPLYTEVVLRGMARFVPALAPYLDRLPRGTIDGGYYTKTEENRPLIGPLPVAGAYVFAALSGFGLMAAPAGAELLAAHITGAPIPDHAAAFLPSRYDDAAYREQLAHWGYTGQL